MTRSFASMILLFLLTASALSQGDAGLEVRLPDEGAVMTPQTVRFANSFAKTNASFARFLGENPGWEFRYNELTNNPHRAWGAGIPIEGFPAITLMNAPQAGRQFVRENAALLNADPANLRMLYSEIVDGKAYQKFIQTHHGIDVLNSYVDLRISRDGRVFMFGSDAKPGLSVDTAPSLGVDAARAFAKAGFAVPPADDRITGGTLFILPLKFATRIDARLVYNFVVNAGPEDVWNTFVDAHSGAVLWRKNLVQHFHRGDEQKARPAGNTVNGRLMMSVYKDSWLVGASMEPVPNAYVNVGGKEYITDADGRFTADIGAELTAPVVARLAGQYSLVRRGDSTAVAKNGRIATSAIAGQELSVVWDSTNSTAAERCIYFHMTTVRNYLRGIDPSNKLADIDRQITGVANINASCNANWDGTRINFFAKSATCGNTGEIADVIYHEYGHAVNQFLYTKLKGSSMSNGTLGEATSDILANMLRDDPRIGIGFMLSGSPDGLIRNSDNTRRYPENLVNEIHDDGMILSGAVWDMRKAIGLEVSRKLTHYVKYGTPDGTTTGEVFADYFIEILVADDDDGNLANGTPHSADIIPAFVKHGIPASGLTLSFNPLGDQTSVTNPYPMNGDILVAPMINQNLLTVSEITLVYTTDNWATTQTMPMTVNTSAKRFSGNFPAQKAGSIVRYYYDCKDNYGSTFRVPTLAPMQNYLFLVGFISRAFYDSELADGWTVEADCETGKWVRAKPVGTWNTSLGSPPDVPYVQPNADKTPGLNKDRCWVTGNALTGEDLGTNDVDNGVNDLLSKAYDVTTYTDPVIRYYRWYSNDAGANPGIGIWAVRISSDGGATWKDIEQTHEANASWKPMVFRIKDYVELSDKFKIKFSASDSVVDKQSLVEAAVDDFEILEIDKSLVGVEHAEALPARLDLEQNYPNPFNPSTTIAFSLPEAAAARISIYSPLGMLVSVPVNGMVPAGRHSLRFDARGLPSGVYTCELLSGGRRLTRAMVVMK